MNYYLDPFTQIIRENGGICMLGAGAAGIRRYQLGAEQLQLLTRLMQAEALPEQTLREGLTEQVFEEWKALSWLTEERPDTVTLDSRTEAFYRAYGMQDAGGKLKERSVLILGCGGIGTHMAWHMTLLGVGSLTLVDYDTVEESNLNRQLLFDLDDVGKRKVEVLRQKLLRIRPDAKINAVSAKIENEQMLDEICAASHYDLIIKALDTPAEFPKWLDAVCRRRRIAYTAGITLQERAMIGPTFLPGISETGLSDILPPPASEKIYGTAPSLGILLYHISDALAVESFRILTGCGRPQYCGKLVAENLFDGTAEEYGPAAQKPAVQAQERERSADISTPAALLFAAAGLLHRTALPFGWLFVLLAPLLCRAPKAESGKRMFVNAAIMGLATFFRLARLLPSAGVALTALGLVGILGIVSLGIILTCALRKRRC